MSYQFCRRAFVSVFLVVCFNSFVVSAPNLSPNFGVGYYEFNSLNPDTFAKEKLVPVIKEYYQLSADDELVIKRGYKQSSKPTLIIYSYNEISTGRYLVYAYIEDSIEIMTRIAPNDVEDVPYLEDRWGNRSKAPMNVLLAIVDINERTVSRLWRREKMQPLSNLRMSAGGRYSSGNVEVYGCLQGYPTTLADINGDDIEDLIFIGGSGALYLPDEQITANTQLALFLGKDFEKELLSINLHEEDFYFYFHRSGSKYQVSRDKVGSVIKDLSHPKEFIRGTPDNVRPGYRTFAKVYFGDFDKDSVQSILVWRRYYLSRKKSDPVKGFEFDREEFELYDFKGGVAKAVGINDKQGHSILDNHQLDWNDGFPSQSKCSNNDGKYPKIMDYGHPELSINDPVISN